MTAVSRLRRAVCLMKSLRQTRRAAGTELLNMGVWITLCLLLSAQSSSLVAQSKILIPMDLSQTDHLKAYGIAYWVLTKGIEVDWLLNYRGGSFMLAAQEDADVQSETNNMDVVRLEKAPKIAVYAPPTFRPWDDAVALAMEYAEI